MRKSRIDNDFPKKKYTELMAENLPMLRMKLGINQDELAEIIGSSRQMLSLIERGVRPMMWDTFMSMIYVFRINPSTHDLLEFLGLYTQELENFLSISEPGKISKHD